MKFNIKKPHYEYLREKWTAKHRAISQKLTVSGIGGLLLLTTPAFGLLSTQHLLASGVLIEKDEDKNKFLAEELKKVELKELAQIEEILSKNFGFEVRTELEGIRLNRSYGIIGGEQHLYRFPGDNLFKHADTARDWAMYGSAGIAPGLGAWGYFAPSELEFSEKDKLREKYYLAVQTYLAPGFAENVVRYRDFFKFRKMIVVNPQSGQAVVAVVGDAGPAEWTGKHLGGSPEVMHYLGLATGPRKGPVLYFFINDPGDTIPLGPVKAQHTSEV